jgi:hypothetical protein
MPTKKKPKFDPAKITQAQRNRLWREWVKDLLSGKFKRTINRLELRNTKGEIAGNCCLGVACRTFDRLFPGVLNIRVDGEDLDDRKVTVFDGADQYLPTTVRDALGVEGTAAKCEDGYELASLNDEGKTFKDIADIIKSGKVVLRDGVKVTAFKRT